MQFAKKFGADVPGRSLRQPSVPPTAPLAVAKAKTTCCLEQRHQCRDRWCDQGESGRVLTPPGVPQHAAAEVQPGCSCNETASLWCAMCFGLRIRPLETVTFEAKLVKKKVPIFAGLDLHEPAPLAPIRGHVFVPARGRGV